MNSKVAISAVALMVLSACVQERPDSPSRDAPMIGSVIGKVTVFSTAYEFSTPNGTKCVFVSSERHGALSCKFP